MEQYGIEHWNDFVKQYDKYITHTVVAHTKLRAYTTAVQNSWQEQERLMRLNELANKHCRYALNLFNGLLYYGHSSLVKRKPLIYRPLTFVTLEGAKATTDARQTLHLNISLGNLPKQFTTADIETLFKYAWYDLAGQSDDIKVQEYYRQEGKDWTSYTGKEANYDRQRVHGDNSIIVTGSCWIPHTALGVDIS